MNIGLFTDTYFPQVSGVATSIKTLKDTLERKGHSVYIFTTTDPHVDKIRLNLISFVLRVFPLYLLLTDALLCAGCFTLIMLPKN